MRPGIATRGVIGAAVLGVVALAAALKLVGFGEDTFAGFATAVSVVIGLAALAFAVHALERADINSSAATLVALNESFQQAWNRFKQAPNPDACLHEFHELMNLYEVACAIQQERSLVGVSRELLTDYLSETLDAMAKDKACCECVERMTTSPKTFKFIRLFRDERRSAGHPLDLSDQFLK